MNESTDLSAQQPGRESCAAGAAPQNRNLGAALQEDGDAVQNDLRQANELAANLEAQLAGKSKELLHLKFLLSQTKAHFGHLQDSVVAMRKERHKLANDAMRAQGLDIMLARVTAERDRLKNELDGVLEGLAADKAHQAQQALRFDKRDHHIAELTFELMKLRQEVAELRQMHPHPAPAASEPPRPCSLKTSARDDMWLEPDVEIVATERVGGQRGRG